MSESGPQNVDTCQCQTRECNNPTPRHGGENCTGARVRVTNCTIHGGWTAWSAWSACSQTCGFAMKTRRRTCTNPAPAFGGRVCVGHDHDDIVCIDLPPCPVPAKAALPPQNGQWSSWGSWDQCSQPCNGEYPNIAISPCPHHNDVNHAKNILFPCLLYFFSLKLLLLVLSLLWLS